MNKRTDYQVKLMGDSYLCEGDVFTYNKTNNTTVVSNSNGFLYTINKFFN